MHALYYAGTICCEPLTPTFHLSDMRSSVRGYTEQVAPQAECTAPHQHKGQETKLRSTPLQVARALKAAVLAVGHLYQVYSRFMPTDVDANASTAVRDPRLASGLPYVLWDARKVREMGGALHGLHPCLHLEFRDTDLDALSTPS